MLSLSPFLSECTLAGMVQPCSVILEATVGAGPYLPAAVPTLGSGQAVF